MDTQLNNSSQINFSQIVEELKSKPVYEIAQDYVEKKWDHSEIDKIIYQIFTEKKSKRSIGHILRLAQHWIKEIFSNPQNPQKAFEVAEGHYNLGNDLFEIMLDETMTYTSGYWATAQTLAESQKDKLELFCKKLKLEPGMQVLDIGCGWGNFAEYAAKTYNVSVVGLTVSSEQARYAKERCKGLDVDIRIEDYRKIEDIFDRVISIEMIEAVGSKNLATYFSVVERCMKPGALFLLEVISTETVSKYSSAAMDDFFMWIKEFIFPNGYIPRLDQLIEPARSSLVLEDLNNFGSDYDKTLLIWDKNFCQGWHKIKDNYSEEFYRMWRFYLLSCAGVFRTRQLQLYQMVYSKGGIAGGYRF